MDRTDSIHSRYSAPSAETVCDFSDNEYAGLTSANGRISPSSTLDKRPMRRRHKVSSDHAATSPLSSERDREREKDRRRRAHRTKSRTSSSPSSTKRHSLTRSATDPWLLEESLPDLESDDGRHLQTTGRSGGYRRAGLSRRDSLLSNASAGSTKKATPLSQNEDLLNQDRPRDSRKASTLHADTNLPQYSGTKLSASASPRLTSVSGMASGGSSGSSNSTITQASVSKSKSSSRLRRESRGSTLKELSTKESPMRESPVTGSPTKESVIEVSPKEGGSETTPQSGSIPDKPSVFSYLEAGAAVEEWGVVPTSTSVNNGRGSSPSSLTGNSFNSDSGISVSGESPEAVHAKLEGQPADRTSRTKSAARSAFEPLFARQRERAASNAPGAYVTSQYPNPPPTSVPHGIPPPLPQQWIDPSAGHIPLSHSHLQHISPELHHVRPSSRSSSTQSPSQPVLPAETAPPAPKRDISGIVQAWFRKPEVGKQSAIPPIPKAPSNSSGYELLTSTLSTIESETQGGAKLVPLYRRFESLNHRLFLHLQDEVAELEEELRMLDEADRHFRLASAVTAGQDPSPASRRQGASTTSEIEWRRIEVLGRIFTKVGHYNQAVSSYSTLVNSLDPTTPSDIARYKAFLAQNNNPIAEPETTFLSRPDDLMALKRRAVGPAAAAGPATSSSSGAPYIAHLQSSEAVVSLMATVIAVAVLLPILSFKVVSDFLARVVVVIIVAGASMSVLVQSQRADVIMGRHGRKYAAVYVGIMSVVAGVIR